MNPSIRRLFPLVPALLALVFLAFTAGTVAAAPLEDAKQAGLVGEQSDGYLGVVSSDAPPTVQRMVDDINLKRREEYRAIANKNGTSLEAVEALVGQKLVNRAGRGEYVRLPSGQWVQR